MFFFILLFVFLKNCLLLEFTWKVLFLSLIKNMTGFHCSERWWNGKRERKFFLWWEGNESRTIITCQKQEIVPLKQATPKDLCLFAPSYSLCRSLCSHSLSSCLLPPGAHFLLSIHMSAPPFTILPPQIYSGIRNEILSHLWLVLNPFIQNEACENESHWGGVRKRSVLTCSLCSRLSPSLTHTHVIWADLSGSRVNKVKRAEEVTDKRLMFILTANTTQRGRLGGRWSKDQLAVLRHEISGKLECSFWIWGTQQEFVRGSDEFITRRRSQARSGAWVEPGGGRTWRMDPAAGSSVFLFASLWHFVCPRLQNLLNLLVFPKLTSLSASSASRPLLFILRYLYCFSFFHYCIR